MTISQRRRDRQTLKIMRPIARRLGWTLAVHGSQGPKDLDLIAVPWTPEAVSHLELVQALLDGTPDLYCHATANGVRGYEKKPHGRVAVLFSRFPFPGRLIDLSIMPRVPPEAKGSP